MSSELENRLLAQMEELGTKIDRLDRAITGGDKPSEGMIVRLDRLEQGAARHETEAARGRAKLDQIVVGLFLAMLPGLAALIWKALASN